MVGNTKLIKLTKIPNMLECHNNIYAKYEGSNPSGSIKDRPAYYMLQKLKENGILVDGGTIIEATSGNMGISLAYFQKELNYKAIIVMPSSMSQERREMIKKLGAQLELVDGGMLESSKRVKELLNTIPNSIPFRQFEDKNNMYAHYLSTSREIEKEVDADYIFAGIGTGGTISGIGKYYKEKHLKAKIIGIEPYESPLLTKGISGKHLIQGIGANFVPDILEKDLIDEVITCKGSDAIEMAKQIRNIEKIDCGYSSGAALMACINYLKQNKIKNKNVVVIFPDKGDRYLW